MKRSLTIRDKLRLFIKWMTDHKDYGLICTCTYCQSTRIKRTDPHEVHADGEARYTARYECMDCNAVAEAQETWKLRP